MKNKSPFSNECIFDFIYRYSKEVRSEISHGYKCEYKFVKKIEHMEKLLGILKERLMSYV